MKAAELEYLSGLYKGFHGKGVNFFWWNTKKKGLLKINRDFKTF